MSLLHHKSRLASLPEAFALGLFFTLSRLLPLDAASWAGGWLARRIGPQLKWHRIAAANLRHALPERAGEHEHILAGMWDNLGRTLAEYPWLHTKTFADRVAITPADRAILARGGGVLYAGGHLGNWEVAPLCSALAGAPLSLVYRHISNPLVERMLRRIRGRYAIGLFEKGQRGARGALRTLKEGQPLGLLIDQRMNEGIALPFFGQPAMTATAIAEFALRYRTPLFLARAVRENGARFRFEMREIALPESSDSTAVEAVMLTLHAVLEGWIREYPAQWLWIHRRWGRLPQ